MPLLKLDKLWSQSKGPTMSFIHSIVRNNKGAVLCKLDLEKSYLSWGLVRLSSLPIYFLSLFRMPKIVCARLEKIRRDFLWGGGNLDRKPHLVN